MFTSKPKQDFLLFCYILIPGHTAHWCSMSPHFLTRWVPRLGTGYGILGRAHWYPTPFPLPSISGCFSTLFPVSLDFFRVFSLWPKYLHPFARPFLLHTRWVSRLGTGSGPTDLWSQRWSRGVCRAEISIKISALAGAWTSCLSLGKLAV